MLTIKDLDEIEKIVEDKVKEVTSGLPTRDEFFKKMDEVVGELKIIREEQPLINHHLDNHEDGIAKVEKKLQIKTLVIS